MIGDTVRHVVNKRESGVVVALGVVSCGDYPGFWVVVRMIDGGHRQWPVEWVEVAS